MAQNSKQNGRRGGFTLVEVLIAIMLVGIAATVVYTELIASYRILMRSRAKLDAQGMAFDTLWQVYNLPVDQLPLTSVSSFIEEDAPTNSVLFPHGVIVCDITTETNAPNLPDPVYFWDIYVQVWAGTNSPIDFGDRELVRYHVRRYRGDR
jgi:prepilin-type N-terminal cleavage/methylation domain-containing protein